MSRLAIFATVLAVAGVVACGVSTRVSAFSSHLQQDIFAVDCIETTTSTGFGASTEYGCPEPPTIEVSQQLVSRAPMVMKGWFDALNMKSLRVELSDGRHYTLGTDAQLTVVGDRWMLRLMAGDVLSPGVYTVTVVMGAATGIDVVTSRTVQVIAYVPPPNNDGNGTDDNTTGSGSVSQGNGAGGVHEGGVSTGHTNTFAEGSGRGWFGMQNNDTATESSREGDERSGTSGRTAIDAYTPLIEQVRHTVLSYVTFSWLLTFVASALFFGYVFFLLGRHYRHLEEDHRHTLRALKRASHRHITPRRKPLRHAAARTRHRRRHA